MAFETLMGDLKLTAVKMILRALNMVFQTSSIDLWASSLDGSNAFAKLIYPLRSDVSRPFPFLDPNEFRQTLPFFEYKGSCSHCYQMWVLISQPLEILLTLPTPFSPDLCSISRIVLAGPDTFHQLCAATAPRLGLSYDELLSALLDQWIEKVSFAAL